MKKTLFTCIAAGFLAWVALQPGPATAEPRAREPVSWPMLPGETLRALAAHIYPKDRAMQQHFIRATLRLNADVLAGHAADQPFEQGMEILLPDLYELSRYATPAPPAARKARPAAAAPAPAVAADAPVSAVELDNLQKRNQGRRQELETLNQRLRVLESEAAKMQETIQQNRAALPRQ